MGAYLNLSKVLTLFVAFWLLLILLHFPQQPVQAFLARKAFPSGYDPTGGYIDRLVFFDYHHLETDEAFSDLQQGNVMACDFQIPLETMAELEANPNIEVQSELGSSYQHFVLRCSRFPTNMTGYRRALALALDKHLVVENAHGGYGQVMDNTIPPIYSFWTFEPQISAHYYSSDILTANATLDAAHIIDTPDSPHPGWRYYDADMSGNWTLGDKRGDYFAPDGLKIELWAHTNYEPAIQACLVLHDCMMKCGLQGEIVEYDPYTMIEMIYTYNFNLVVFNWELVPPGCPHSLYESFQTESLTNSFFFRFNNSDYNFNYSQFRHASTRLETRNWAWNCSRILLEEMPMIVTCNLETRRAYRIDHWEGYVNQCGRGSIGYNPYTFEQLRLTQDIGGPFGCYPTEYRAVLTDGPNTLTPLDTYTSSTNIVFDLIYSRLWQLDPLDPDCAPAPDLAWNWTQTPTVTSGDIQDGWKYTFHLFENITWHDGTPFTSEDVQYSLMNIHPTNRYVTDGDVAHVYRVDTPDAYTVDIYSNSTAFVDLFNMPNVLIFPKHIWAPHEVDDFRWSMNAPGNLSGTGCYRFMTWMHNQW
ncbi:MAG: ABC transporter substrate-binding protein, partial [Promethearchaeota archaeon]